MEADAIAFEFVDNEKRAKRPIEQGSFKAYIDQISQTKFINPQKAHSWIWKLAKEEEVSYRINFPLNAGYSCVVRYIGAHMYSYHQSCSSADHWHD